MIGSSLEGINSHIQGYFSKVPVAYFGPPMTGKSILCIQELLWLMKHTGRNGLYIDTESGGEVLVRTWEPVLRKKLEVPDGKIFVEDLRTVHAMLGFHGFNVNLTVSKKGKIEVIYSGEVKSKIDKMVKKHDIGIVIYDSMSNPLKISFPGGRMNFPARASVTNMWFEGIHTTAVDHDLITIATHHQSRDPTNQYARPSMGGGDAVLYNFKVSMYLEQRKFRPHSNIRNLYLVRWFNAKEWEKVVPLYLDKDGYRDISDDEIAKLGKRRKK